MADPNIRQQVLEILSDPMNLPSTFWDYDVQNWIKEAPVFPIGQVFGLKQSFVGGSVTSAGAVAIGTLFTVAKGAAGEYTITFSPQMATTPVVTITVNSNAGAVLTAVAANVTATGFGVNTFNQAGTKTDAAFYFTAQPAI